VPVPYRVCFVCTGNICRSPMAESVFRRYLEKADLTELVEVDSAGTAGWHAGGTADPRAVHVLQAGGYGCRHQARRFEAGWFASRDLVIALDHGHLRALRRLAPDADTAGRIRLLRSFDPAVDPGAVADLDVPDPYYGELPGFEDCLALVEAACLGLLDHVAAAVAER
jgi:protein-tyrosine phosphatase